MTTRKTFAAALAVILTTAFVPPALAQAGHGDHAMPGSAKPVADPQAAGPAEREYREAADRMHAAMGSMTYSGNADVDFLRGMIPHHQAAIDMARTVLKHGADPEIRRLAEDVIAAQEREIGEMEKWLAAHTKR